MSETAIKQDIEIVFPVSDDKLDQLKEQYAMVPDCTTKDGYKLAKANRSELRKLRITVDDSRKKMTEEWRQKTAKCNSIGKDIIDKIKALEEPLAIAIKAEDTRKAEEKAAKVRAEQERVAAIRQRINDIGKLLHFAPGTTSKEVKIVIDETWTAMGEELTEENCAECLEEAKKEHELVGYRLQEILRATIETEEREAEAAEQRRIAEEKRRKEEEAFARKKAAFEKEQAQAAERQRLEDEARAKEEAAREEQRRKEDEERQRKIDEENARIQAENQKLEAEKQRIREEAKRRAAEEQAKKDAEEKAKREEEERKANEALQVERRREAIIAMNYIDDGEEPITSQSILTAIIAGKIPWVKYTG